MKDCQKFQFGSHLVPRCLPEITNKLDVPIRYLDFGQPMQLDMIKTNDSYLGHI